MCGISGIWNLNERRIEQAVAEKFNNTIAHRGPDDKGIYVDATVNIALGHRRLSILDLSEAGQQPMYNADKSLVITFNGEIYNYIELRTELKAKGYVFKSHTDTEVILAAYQEWGTKCLYRFNGMWAFAIWDISKKSIFLSRDRFGVKPLYYVHQRGKLFAFSSESLSFNHLDGFQKEFSRKNMNLGIRDPFYLESIGETLYKDIVKLKPGHYLLLDKSGRLEIKKWWKTEDHLVKIPSTYDEQVEQFRSLFLDACKLRLRSDVPVGIALSGGLDSSSVYSTVQQIYKQNEKDRNITEDGQTAFIACFPGTKMDEKEYADEVIQFHNGKAKYIFPEEKDISNSIYYETKAEDFIYLSPPVVHSIYREMRKNNVKVSLDGHGADEMLFGYSNMIAEWIRAQEEGVNYEDLQGTWAEMQGMPKEEAERLFSMAKNTGGPSVLHTAYEKWVPVSLKRMYRKRAFEKQKSTSWLLDYNEFEKNRDKLSINFTNPSFTIPYQSFHIGMLPTLLRNWDRASMRHGVEIRMPFMDWRLVTYVFSLPGTTKVNNGYSKKIVRDAMKNWMPESIRLRKNKIGVNAPMEEWFNGPMNKFVLDAVHTKSFLHSDIWNGPLLRDYAIEKCLHKKWTQKECNSFWPYLNAWILQN